MNPEDTDDYNKLVDIINEVQNMFEKLDEYRKESKPDDKMKRLFAVRSHEWNIKRMINREQERLELRESQKQNTAA